MDIWQLIGRCKKGKREFKDFIGYRVLHDGSKRPDFKRIEKKIKVIEYNFRKVKKIYERVLRTNFLEKMNNIENEILRKRDLTSLSEAFRPSYEETGYVYFLKSSNGPVKIGKTNNLDQRIKQIKPKMPFQSNLIHSWRCDEPLSIESCLHDFFKEQRVNGEWFELTEKDVQWIKSINSFFVFFDEGKKEIWNDLERSYNSVVEF